MFAGGPLPYPGPGIAPSGVHARSGGAVKGRPPVAQAPVVITDGGVGGTKIAYCKLLQWRLTLTFREGCVEARTL